MATASMQTETTPTAQDWLRLADEIFGGLPQGDRNEQHGAGQKLRERGRLPAQAARLPGRM